MPMFRFNVSFNGVKSKLFVTPMTP